MSNKVFLLQGQKKRAFFAVLVLKKSSLISGNPGNPEKAVEKGLEGRQNGKIEVKSRVRKAIKRNELLLTFLMFIMWSEIGREKESSSQLQL